MLFCNQGGQGSLLANSAYITLNVILINIYFVIRVLVEGIKPNLSSEVLQSIQPMLVVHSTSCTSQPYLWLWSFIREERQQWKSLKYHFFQSA